MKYIFHISNHLFIEFFIRSYWYLLLAFAILTSLNVLASISFENLIDESISSTSFIVYFLKKTNTFIFWGTFIYLFYAIQKFSTGVIGLLITWNISRGKLFLMLIYGYLSVMIIHLLIIISLFFSINAYLSYSFNSEVVKAFIILVAKYYLTVFGYFMTLLFLASFNPNSFKPFLLLFLFITIIAIIGKHLLLDSNNCFEPMFEFSPVHQLSNFKGELKDSIASFTFSIIFGFLAYYNLKRANI
jgi:hypothetical protein